MVFLYRKGLESRKVGFPYIFRIFSLFRGSKKPKKLKSRIGGLKFLSILASTACGCHVYAHFGTFGSLAGLRPTTSVGLRPNPRSPFRFALYGFCFAKKDHACTVFGKYHSYECPSMKKKNGRVIATCLKCGIFHI